MSWLTNEVMFYGGIIIAISSLVISMVYMVSSHIRRLHIEAQMEKEYGMRLSK